MQLISFLDIERAKLLKITLKIKFFRGLLFSRSDRILFLAMTALCFYLAVSLLFPMWVLLVGPILWGVPHLISSLRYSTLPFFESGRQKQLILIQSLIWMAVFVYRLSVDIFNINLFWSQSPLLFEGVCLFASFFFQIYLKRKFDLNSLCYFLVFSILLLATSIYPVQTALTLLIAHNYVPLFAWYRSAQRSEDRRVFYLVAGVYILFSVLILSGSFHFLYKFFTPQGTLSLFDWNFNDLFAPYGAKFSDSAFWFRITSLYAFSQSIHYFLWIKAIPENYQPQQHPPSFKWSFGRLANDFGSSSIFVLMTVVFLGLAYWFFFEFQTARLVYFSIASYHGFMEISSLPFIQSNRKS